jgi:hypothetical protein
VFALEAVEENEGGYRGLAEKFFNEADRNGQADLSTTGLGGASFALEDVVSVGEGVNIGSRSPGDSAWALVSQLGGSGAGCAVAYHVVPERS